MPIQPREKTIDDYKAAYRAANGRDIDVDFKAGWFRFLVDGVPIIRKRESQMLELTDNLLSRIRGSK